MKNYLANINSCDAKAAFQFCDLLCFWKQQLCPKNAISKLIIKVIFINLFSVFCAGSLVNGQTVEIDKVKSAVVRSLPVGWKVIAQKTNEIPWGHHWNEDYSGLHGILLIVKGLRPVNVELCGTNGVWQALQVATESLEIWLMPSNYVDSISSKFSVGRPIQPVIIFTHGPIKVYARPSHLLNSKKTFDDILQKSSAVKWPDSPANNPELLTWKNWQVELKNELER